MLETKLKLQTKAYAAETAGKALAPLEIKRREPGPNDVLIDIKYCGVCHSDLHQARDEWGGAIFPMVPGHEIAGVVAEVGGQVSKFKKGDKVGVGCLVDSCRTCASCKEGLEQFCENGNVATYNSREKDGKTPTYGGYSTRITVDENFVLRMPENVPLDKAAPLLCAGITTYSPLRRWEAGPGKRVGVLGFGGLGHMAVQLGAAMGAEVIVLSQSLKKRDDGKRLGATDYFATSDSGTFKKLANSFDLMINTISADVDLNDYLKLLKRDGTMVWVGAPPNPAPIEPFSLIFKRRSITGSLIGGIAETQEMLDFCDKHKIGSVVEVIPINQINEAWDRMVKGDVRYRFVIDIASLG